MKFLEKKWTFAGILSILVILTIVSSGFCEPLNFPDEYSDMADAIYASQEAVYATSQESAQRCSSCHVDIIQPHHPDWWNAPNTPYNPYCPDSPPSSWACTPCHYNYDEDCQRQFSGAIGEGCVACHTLSTQCGWELEIPAHCINEILPGGCFQQPEVMIQELVGTVIELNLQQGISNSLDAKLESALGALDDLNTNNDVAAINSLNAFINAVEAQRGNTISNEDADTLIAAAQAIIDKLEGP